MWRVALNGVTFEKKQNKKKQLKNKMIAPSFKTS